MKTALTKRPTQRNAFRNNYVAAIIAAAAFLFSLQSFAQVDTTKVRQKINAYGYDYKNFGVDSSFKPPRDTFKLRLADSGAIATIGTTIYRWSGRKWDVASASGTSGPLGDSLSWDATFDTLLWLKSPAEARLKSLRFRSFDTQILLIQKPAGTNTDSTNDYLFLINNTAPLWATNKIYGVPILNSLPTNGQVLAYNSSTSRAEWSAAGGNDNWGTQTVAHNATLYGGGTFGDPLVVDTTSGGIASKYEVAQSKNSNAGSYFRWLNPSTQAIRTAAAGWGFVIDSTTNSNALTFKPDTTSGKIATQYYVDHAVAGVSGGASPAKLDSITSRTFETIIGPYNSINYNRNYDSTIITVPGLVNRNVLTLALDGSVLTTLPTNGLYYSFDKTTGALTLHNGNFVQDQTVHVLFDKQVFSSINLAVVGNSMMNGAQTSDPRSNSPYSIFAKDVGEGTPSQDIFPFNKSVGNRALKTTCCGAGSPSMLSSLSTDVYPLYDATKRNVAIVWEGINQLYYTGSKAGTIAAYWEVCDSLKAHGWEVVIATSPGRTTAANAGFNTPPILGDDTYGQNIKQANAEVMDTLRARYSLHADGLLDIAAITALNNYPDAAGYPSIDGTHPGDYVAALMGHAMADSMLVYLAHSKPNQYYVVSNASALASYKSLAGITDAGEVTAVNNLFSQLSQAGLWQYIDQLYPLLGDATNGYKVNAKSPGNYTLVAINPGGVSDVLTFNKTTGLTTANNARVEVPRKDSTIWEGSYGIGIYTNKNTSAATPYVFGSGNSSIQYFGSDFKAASFDGSNTSVVAMDYPTYSTGNGFFYIGRDEYNRRQAVNNSVTSTIDQKVVLPSSHYNTNNLPFGCYYFDATPTIFPATVPVRFGTIVITKGLPADKIQQLQTIIHNYNRSLGRGYDQIN